MADVGRPADLAARDRLISAITDRLGDVVPIKIIIAIVELEHAVRAEERRLCTGTGKDSHIANRSNQ